MFECLPYLSGNNFADTLIIWCVLVRALTEEFSVLPHNLAGEAPTYSAQIYDERHRYIVMYCCDFDTCAMPLTNEVLSKTNIDKTVAKKARSEKTFL